MNHQAVDQIEKSVDEINQTISFNWIDNPAVQTLLDVLASIIAEEYIEVAHQNPDLFSKNGGFK